MNSKLLGQKIEKHEIRMLSCDGEAKADEYWMSEKPCGFMILQMVIVYMAGEQCARL